MESLTNPVELSEWIHKAEMETLENVFLLPAVTQIDRDFRSFQMKNVQYYEQDKPIIHTIYDGGVSHD